MTDTADVSRVANFTKGAKIRRVGIGENIIAARTRRGWATAGKLAEEIHQPASTVSRWENDKVVPDLSSLVTIALATETTIGTLIEGFDAEYDAFLAQQDTLTQLREHLPSLRAADRQILLDLVQSWIQRRASAPPAPITPPEPETAPTR